MLRLRSGVLGLVFTSAIALASANAADMYRAPEGGGLKDGPFYAPVNSWAGFYIGANGGGAWNADNSTLKLTGIDDVGTNFATTSSTKADLDPTGGFGGGQIGYNIQRGRFVFGIEADFQGSHVEDSIKAKVVADDATSTADLSDNLRWFGTVRGRIGYTFDRALVYATGGFAFGRVESNLKVVGDDGNTATAHNDDTQTGFVVGGGIEYALSPAWSIKGEYQFIDLGDSKLVAHTAVDDDDATGSVNIHHNYHTARVGLNYHLNTYEPLK